MMQSFFSRLLWAFILLVFQGLVFNHIHFFGYATPVIYVYILCLQPLNTSRYAWLLWGFAVGLGADFFSETPGSGGCIHDFDGLVRSATFAVVYAQRLSGRHGAGLPDVGRMELHLVCDVACAVAAGVRDDA